MPALPLLHPGHSYEIIIMHTLPPRRTYPAHTLPCSIHPFKVGFTVLAELLVAAVARGVEEAASGRAMGGRDDSRLQGLPPPMIPHSSEEHTTYCAMQVRAAGCCMRMGVHTRIGAAAKAASMRVWGAVSRAYGAKTVPFPSLACPACRHPTPPPACPALPSRHSPLQEAFKRVVAAHSSGFAYRPERPDGSSFVDQKWGWSATKPGGGGVLGAAPRCARCGRRAPRLLPACTA